MGLGDLKSSYTDLIMDWIDNQERNKNESVNFAHPYVRQSLRYVYPLFIFLHAFVALVGTAGNVAIVITIIKRQLYRYPTFFFLGNIALSDAMKACVVLPITLANLLIQNWIFGSFLCFFLPMMQSFPNHASILTYLMIAVDRYRSIVHPMKSRVPAGLCVIAVWVVSVCVVLPYAVYLKYLDLEQLLGEEFHGVGICWLNVERHIEEYIRAMFVTLYILPLAIMAFLYLKVSAELKCRDSMTVSVHIGPVTEDSNVNSVSDGSYHSRVTWSTSESDQRIEPEGASGESAHMKTYVDRTSQESDDDIDIHKEKRTQKYMMAMVVLFAMCWCPLNILILVTHFVNEDPGNVGHFDITYLTFTFFGFMSTCINPVLFASWRMSDQTKDRLRGYFRFSNRRRSSAHLALSRTPESYISNRTSESYVSNRTPSPMVQHVPHHHHQHHHHSLPKSYV